MSIVNQIRIRLRQPQRHCESTPIMPSRNLFTPSPPPLAQHVARPRRDVLRGEGEAVLGENGVLGFQPFKVHCNGSCIRIVRQAHSAVGVRDGGGVVGHWEW